MRALLGLLILLYLLFESWKRGGVNLAAQVAGGLLALGAISLLLQVAVSFLWQGHKRAVIRLAAVPSRIAARNRRNTVASSALSASDSSERFALYLRPFTIDQANSLDITVRGFDVYTTHLEGALVEALDGFCDVIGLGVSSGLDRAGAAEATELDWQKKFDVLADRAHLICVVPILRPGTHWEVKRLVERRYLYKTLFIFPPINSLRVGRRRDEIMRAKLSSIERLQDSGLEFPAVGESGALARVLEDGSVRTLQPFPQLRGQLRTDIVNLFPSRFTFA